MDARTIINDALRYFAANQVRSADEIGRKQLDVLNDDWVQMLVGNFSYSADNVVATTFDAPTYFQVGDRLWITQGGTVKYFFVIIVEANSITLTAGDMYIFTNAAFTYIALSRVVSPVGFPTLFTFSSTLVPSTGSVTAQGTFTGQFFMVGRIVAVAASRIGLTLNGTPVFLNETLPIDPSISLILQYGIGDLSGGASGRLVSSIAGIGTGSDNVRLDRIDYSSFPTATLLNLAWNQTFLYS